MTCESESQTRPSTLVEATGWRLIHREAFPFHSEMEMRWKRWRNIPEIAALARAVDTMRTPRTRPSFLLPRGLGTRLVVVQPVFRHFSSNVALFDAPKWDSLRQYGRESLVDP